MIFEKDIPTFENLIKDESIIAQLLIKAIIELSGTDEYYDVPRERIYNNLIKNSLRENNKNVLNKKEDLIIMRIHQSGQKETYAYYLNKEQAIKDAKELNATSEDCVYIVALEKKEYEIVGE